MKPSEFRNPQAGRTLRTKDGYWTFIPAPLPAEIKWSSSLISALAEAERELSQLNFMAGSFPFSRLLAQPFIRREALLSSQIEGIRASLTDLYNYESGQLALFGSRNDVREVHHCVLALDHGLQRLQTLPVSLHLIREMHAKLMTGVRGAGLMPGKFRTSQNWIGPAGSTLETAMYVPPTVDEMKSALIAFERFMHVNTKIPTLARVAMFHYQFEAIHPFLGGNGRIGRMIIMLLFHEWGILSQPLLNLSSYFEHHRQEYYDHLLAVSQQGQWEEWLFFFLRGIRKQARESLLCITSLQGIYATYSAFVQADRHPLRMNEVIDFVFSCPIFSIKQLAGALHITRVVAKRYVNKLVNAKVLFEISGSARNQIFQAKKIFEALVISG